MNPEEMKQKNNKKLTEWLQKLVQMWRNDLAKEFEESLEKYGNWWSNDDYINQLAGAVEDQIQVLKDKLYS